MRDLKNKLTSSKNSSNIQLRRGKSFGYQVLGFGAGGVPPMIEATGGTITESGDFRIHTFTGPGSFAVTKISGCSADNAMDYLVIAGGGAGGDGGTGESGGGGGAGRPAGQAVQLCQGVDHYLWRD